MNFNDLDQTTKQELHLELTSHMNSVGGMNLFLQMLEDIRTEKPHPLLGKTATWHYKNGKITWGKSIFKETLVSLFDAMRKEEKDGDMINGLKPKDYKATMNMMRALRPVSLEVIPKNLEDANGFSVNILDASEEKKTKVTLMFKTIVFYNIDFAKEILNYKAPEA